MRVGDTALPRYLAEWYTPRLSERAIIDVARRVQECLQALPAGPNKPRLVYALEVSEDSYAFAVFAAESASVVCQACEDAGLPADRVTAALEAPLPDLTR
jgi:hypothetical protein